MRTIVILVFASTLAVPIANIAQLRNGAIVGRVMTAEGMPAAEVRISAMPLPNDKGIASTAAAAAGVTDLEGRYRISNLPAGRYAVLPNIGYDPSLTLRQTHAAPAIVVRPGAETLRDISLEPQGRVTISGRVNQELMPRYARTVSLGSGDRVLQARVATEGNFSFTGVPKGTYWLSLPVATFAWTSKQIHVENEDITDIDVTPEDSIPVMGRVVTENGFPVPAFLFSLEGPKGVSLHGYWTTDTVQSTGMIEVIGWADKPNDVLFQTALPIGEYRIAVSGLPPGYTVKSFAYGATNLLKEPLKLTGEVRQLAIILTPASEASGVKVRGKLIRDASLPPGLSTRRFVLNSPRLLSPLEVPIRSDGSFELADVPPGVYWISEPRLWLSLTVGSRNIAGLEFRTSTMRAAYEEAVRRAALPRAPASTSPGAEPLDSPDPPEREQTTSARESQGVTVSGRAPGASNSRVTLEAESSFHESADENGLFSFTGVPPGIYRAYTGAFAGTPFPKTVVVGDADVHDLELSPHPARKIIKGRIFVDAGHSIPLIALTVRPNVDSGPPFEHPYTITSHYSRHGFGLIVASDGRFTIELPEGRHRLRVDVYPDSYRVASVMYGSMDLMKDLLPIDEAEPKEISIKLSTVSNAPWGQVTGRVSGLPNVSPAVRVALLSRSNLQLEAEPKRDGSFEFAKVPPDTYTVLTTPRIAALPPQSIVVTEINPARVAVTIPSQRTLAVRVLSESGSPRSGAGTTLRLTLSKTEAYAINLSLPFLMRTGNEMVCIVDVCGSSEKMFGEPSIKRGDNDGVFSLTLPEAEYRVEASVQQGKSLRSLTSGTINLVDQPLRVGPTTADITITVSD